MLGLPGVLRALLSAMAVLKAHTEVELYVPCALSGLFLSEETKNKWGMFSLDQFPHPVQCVVSH